MSKKLDHQSPFTKNLSKEKRKKAVGDVSVRKRLRLKYKDAILK